MEAAVKDCSYVLHIDSPVPAEEPRNENEIITPAVDGVINVLSACAEVGGIKRVVLTSSLAAITPGHTDQQELIDESFWADLKACAAYEKSKTLAERAAWDYVKNLPEDKRFELAVINPGVIVGPVIVNIESAAITFTKKILNRDFPMVPDLNAGCINVRDVALAHITAMTLPEAAGHRHILALPLTFHNIALMLNDEFESQGYNIPTRKAPKFLVWLLSWFDPQAKVLLPYVDKTDWKMSNDRMVRVLGIEPRDLKEAVVSMGYSIIEAGMVKKTAKYHGRSEQKED